MSRKPIAALPLLGQDDDGQPATTQGIAVLCDDGSYFSYSFREGEWVRHPGIPGTAGEDRDGK